MPTNDSPIGLINFEVSLPKGRATFVFLTCKFVFLHQVQFHTPHSLELAENSHTFYEQFRVTWDPQIKVNAIEICAQDADVGIVHVCSNSYFQQDELVSGGMCCCRSMSCPEECARPAIA